MKRLDLDNITEIFKVACREFIFKCDNPLADLEEFLVKVGVSLEVPSEVAPFLECHLGRTLGDIYSVVTLLNEVDNRAYDLFMDDVLSVFVVEEEVYLCPLFDGELSVVSTILTGGKTIVDGLGSLANADGLVEVDNDDF